MEQCCSLHDNKEWDKVYCQKKNCCKKCPYLLQSDFPTAWEVMRKTKPNQHHERCSYRQSNGGVLCDCAAEKVFIETVKMQQKRAAQELGRLGGSVKNWKKAKASRENGKKGGRPKSKEEEKLGGKKV